MSAGNPYPHRYKDKRVYKLEDGEFEKYYEVAKGLQSKVNVPALLSIVHYTGLRISEVCGDTPHKYVLPSCKRHSEPLHKETEALHGLRKMDLSIEGDLIMVDVKEVRKHGKREEPVWIPVNKLGADEIVNAWKLTVNPNDRIFPCTKWLGWYLVSKVTEGKLYPHYFRLNRATSFASDERVSLFDMMKWFAWSDPRTCQHYLGTAGRTTKPMAERMK